MQDVIARFKEQHSDFSELPSKAVFTMNDTHPTIAVAELMRLLIDQEGLDWDQAWGITCKVCTVPLSLVHSTSASLHSSNLQFSSRNAFKQLLKGEKQTKYLLFAMSAFH